MSSNLKVLQVIPKLGYGGAETGCFDIAHYLKENNCGSYIVTSGGDLLRFINKDKVKVIKLPVQSKNPLIIFFNFLALIGIILFNNISIVHARSRAPAWSCLFAAKITGRKFVTTFHGTYNFKSKLKKFYNSVMVRSDLIIAGSNFIFSHIKQNYSKYLDAKKKLLVIFRGINVDYFDPSTKLDIDEKKLLKKWQIEKDKKIILLPNALFGTFKRFKVDYRVVPWCTFSSPAVARVGLNETEANAAGVAFETTRFDVAELDRAKADDARQGFVKVLTAPASDKILGVTIVSEHAGETISEFVLAMKYNLGLKKIMGTIHIYPTWSEMNKFAAGVWRRANKPERFMPLLAWYHRIRRGGG